MPISPPSKSAVSARLPAALLAELVARGWSVRRLSQESGETLSTCQRVLAGTDPRVSTLAPILRSLGLSWGWLDTV